MGNRSGLTIPSMRVSGLTTRPMEKASSGAPTETHMRGIGSMTRLMALVTSSHKMGKSATSVNGRTTSTMGKVLKAGLMVHDLMVISPRARRMGSGHTSGQMAHSTPVIG